MKRPAIIVLIAICICSLFGCGIHESDEGLPTDAGEVAEEAVKDKITEEVPEETPVMTREEVIGTYFLPMEDKLAAYYQATDPVEIKNIAQEYNMLGLEGRTAYIEAIGEAPNIELIPRSEYQLRCAYYRVIKDQVSGKGTMYDYNDMYYGYTREQAKDENGNPYPTNMFTSSNEGQLCIDPEASDSYVYLVNWGEVEEGAIVTKLIIIRDGGQSVHEVLISDYTEEMIFKAEVIGEYVLLHKAKRVNDEFIVYKDMGTSLEYVTEYYEYDKSADKPDTAYDIEKVYIQNRDIETEFLEEAEDLRLSVNK